MASQGPLSPGTMANQTGVGLVPWQDVDNAKVLDGVAALAELGIGTDVDMNVRLVKGGAVTGANMAISDPFPFDEYVAYGGEGQLWGTALTSSDVNASDFGFVINFQNVDEVLSSNYLKATNFGFSIGVGATITGVLAEVYRIDTGESGVEIDHVRMTVYYTPAPTTSTSSSISTSSTSTSISTSLSTSSSTSISTSTTTVITMPVAGSIRPFIHRSTIVNTIPRSALRIRR